jgi:histidinol-phosphate aminotransferase
MGLDLSPGVANFVLVRFPPPRGPGGAFAFLQSRGILTRKVAAYGLPEHLRITIGTEEEMRAVASAVKEFLSAS